MRAPARNEPNAGLGQGRPVGGCPRCAPGGSTEWFTRATPPTDIGDSANELFGQVGGTRRIGAQGPAPLIDLVTIPIGLDDAGPSSGTQALPNAADGEAIKAVESAAGPPGASGLVLPYPG